MMDLGKLTEKEDEEAQEVQEEVDLEEGEGEDEEGQGAVVGETPELGLVKIIPKTI